MFAKSDVEFYKCHARATQDTSVWFQLLASPLTKWNIPVPSKLGRENRCVLQNRNGIFPTSELSFTRGFMYELMTDWWRIIINNILPLPESILDYSFKLTLNHQGPYNSKMNRHYGKLIMNACITLRQPEKLIVFTVFRQVFHSTLKLELCRHACRRRDPIISTCRYGKNMPTTALVNTDYKYRAKEMNYFQFKRFKHNPVLRKKGGQTYFLPICFYAHGMRELNPGSTIHLIPERLD